MPAVSKAQRTAMAVAEHAPGKLYARNKGMLGMSKSQLHDFAATKEKGLPQKVKSTKSAAKRNNKDRAPGATAPLKAALRARRRDL